MGNKLTSSAAAATHTPRTLLITGAYGTGKSTLAAEMAELLADRHIPCAAIDLDWLGWFWLPGDRGHTVNDIVVANLRAVAAHYSDAGVDRLILAGTIRTPDELAALADLDVQWGQGLVLAGPATDWHRTSLEAAPDDTSTRANARRWPSVATMLIAVGCSTSWAPFRK